MSNTNQNPIMHQPASIRMNPWGVAALVAAIVSLPIRYLWLNSLSIFEWCSASDVYVFVVAIRIVKYLPYFALALGAAGFLLAAGRSRKSSIAAIVLAGGCFAMVFVISNTHTIRAESFRRVTGLIDQYRLVHNAYPEDLSDVPGLTQDDQQLITYLPGASKDETVTWKISGTWSLWSLVGESPRLVCFLNKITLGERIAYLSNGKTVAIATTDDFQQLLDASRKEQHEPHK